MSTVLIIGKTIKQGKTYIDNLFGNLIAYKNANIYQTLSYRFVFTDLDNIENKSKKNIVADYVIVTGNLTLKDYQRYVVPLMSNEATIEILD